jgi:hypothetical protein
MPRLHDPLVLVSIQFLWIGGLVVRRMGLGG